MEVQSGSWIIQQNRSEENMNRQEEQRCRTPCQKKTGETDSNTCKKADATEKETGKNQTGAGCQTERQKMGR